MDLPESSKDQFLNFKSKEIYLKWISAYKNWVGKFNSQECPTSVLLFLQDLSDSYAPTSLWSIYAIVNKYMKVQHSINLNDHELIKDYLKGLSKYHNPEKSNVLSRKNIDDYLDLPETDQNIAIKAALVIGIHGLLRRIEITELFFEDVEKIILEDEEYYKILIKKSKTDISAKGFYFVVKGDDTKFIDIYMKCIPLDDRKGRFFRKILNGKGTNRNIGKNTISSFPKIIAEALNLENKDGYTGHCFRRTGATLLADGGADKIVLKRAGRWKSDTVCEGYVEESIDSKLQISKKICPAGSNIVNIEKDRHSKVDNDVKNVSNMTFNNCNGPFVFNLN
jgi:integrase